MARVPSHEPSSLSTSRGIAGLPEAALPPDLAARLPATTPAAPWRGRATVITWWHPAAAGALDAVPQPLRARPHRATTLWMLVRYDDTPVGPYREILVSPVMLRKPTAITVPFIAVDSVASVAGGREHWALPKALAT